MRRLVECVPNFSEGRNQATIDAIARAIREVDGVMLLDIDPGRATNRTVYTFVGEPEAVLEAAFRAISTAAELIDMSKHRGEHPRIGATDVCPFVPVAGVTMEECVELAHRLGRRVGEELRIPVYLYEEAATRPDRKSLAEIRRGEYEGLREKLRDPQWRPDYGPAEFNPKTGATVIGAREFLIAYNVNLNTRDKRLAHEIALTLRETGRAKRDAEGNILRDQAGNPIREPGRLKAVRAVGWYIEEYGCAQVSMNLLNWKITPPHLAFEEVCREAERLGLRVTGSEIVGMIPLEPILEAGRYFLRKQGKSAGVPEAELIQVAVRSLGLNDVAPFEPQQKILEYRIQEPGSSFRTLPFQRLADLVSMDSPTPGGGSVAALAGALAAALGAMVANLTVGKKGYETHWSEMDSLAVEAQAIKDRFLQLADEDSRAFDRVMAAFSLPKGSDEERKARVEAIEEATRGAASVPLEVLKETRRLLHLLNPVARFGNANAVSDAGVAAAMALACAEGAYWNVLINLGNLQDQEWSGERRREAEALLEEIRAAYDEARSLISSRLLPE
ncbi:MAG: glutamate formimidoyltransferase [candidate division KSB1 bacterium]|nr:glutamate formimidoyltransferase [candidate division KSB1 bacterium]